MNFSLRARVFLCFLVATVTILLLSFLVFSFLSSLKVDIAKELERTHQTTLYTDELRISVVSISKYQRKLQLAQNRGESVERLKELCEGLVSQLQQADGIYADGEIKKIITTMITYVNSFRIILDKASFFRDRSGLETLNELSDKILESFTDFQNIQYVETENRDNKLTDIIDHTKQNMMLTLVIGLLASILLSIIMPGKIALPFKKINDAIRELQECNFDVSISYDHTDEIGEIGAEMNKMIVSIKRFEELRADRIGLELRKFDALANLVKKPVLVADAEGKLVYLNNLLYELLDVQSDDVLGKILDEHYIPVSVIEIFNLALKRRSKIENEEILIEEPSPSDDKAELSSNLSLKSGDTDENHSGDSPHGDDKVRSKPGFKGYANVIPIRGKQSSQDYYLMVLSEQMFS